MPAAPAVIAQRGHGSNTHNDPERPATAPFAVIRASHVEPSAGTFASAEKTERATIHRAEKTEKAEKAAAEAPAARSESADKPSVVHVEAAVDNAVHNPVEKSATKADSAGEKAVAKQADKPADKPAAKNAEASAYEKSAAPHGSVKTCPPRILQRPRRAQKALKQRSKRTWKKASMKPSYAPPMPAIECQRAEARR